LDAIFLQVMPMTDAQPPPPGWAKDTLSSFLDSSAKNEWATFAAMPDLWRLVAGVDEVFHDYALACMEQIKNQTSDDPSGRLLLCNAHNHYRAALRLCCAGHSVAVYPTGRAALESVLYGWYLITHPEAAKRWHEKPPTTEAEARKKWGQEFSFGTINRLLQKVASEPSERTKNLHEESIAFGSHPNTDAVYANMKFERRPEGAWVGLHFLHGWDAALATYASIVTSIGLFSIELIMHADPTGAASAKLPERLPPLIAQHSALAKHWLQEFAKP
jgi:hypothetical protein